jgi:hypothetical protein
VEEHLLEKWLKVLRLSESWSPSHLISRLGGRGRQLRVIGRCEGVSLSAAVRLNGASGEYSAGYEGWSRAGVGTRNRGSQGGE